MTCVFCTNVRNAGEVLFEDGRLWVVLHNDWAVRGHSMVVWKEHVENMADLSVDEFLHFALVFHRAEAALLAATRADRAVVLKLGIATPHLHVHIYPVSAALDRPAVMEIIEARVRDPSGARESAIFVEDLRERLTRAS